MAERDILTVDSRRYFILPQSQAEAGYIRDTCGTDGGGRIRRKQKISCSYYPGDAYTCYVGLNLRTGESIPGSTC